MADPAIVRRVQALLSRATDPGATEEEQRTSAHIAAKLCRDHGLRIGEIGGEVADAPSSGVTRMRAEVVVNGVRTVVESVSAGLGLDVFAFAQELMRERAKEVITSTIKKPAPKRRARRARVRAR